MYCYGYFPPITSTVLKNEHTVYAYSTGHGYFSGACAEEIVSALNIVDKLVESGNVKDASDVDAVVELLQQLQPPTGGSSTNELSNASNVNVDWNFNSTRSEEENALRDLVNVTLDVLNTLIGIYDPLLISQSNASAKYARTLGLSTCND